MALIIWFLALVAAGDVLSYLVGLFVEYEWGGYPSLVVFLAMYFITLWVAWRIAVWMTTPKPISGTTPQWALPGSAGLWSGLPNNWNRHSRRTLWGQAERVFRRG